MAQFRDLFDERGLADTQRFGLLYKQAQDQIIAVGMALQDQCLPRLHRGLELLGRFVEQSQQAHAHMLIGSIPDVIHWEQRCKQDLQQLEQIWSAIASFDAGGDELLAGWPALIAPAHHYLRELYTVRRDTVLPDLNGIEGS